MAFQPDVRQPRPRPGARHVAPEIVLRASGLFADEGRAGIAVAELGADHLVALSLLGLGDAHQLWQVVPQRAPLAPAERCVTRGRDIALADRAPLGLVGIEQARPGP